MSGETKELADELIQFAATHGLTFCTAESCSAGALAAALAKGEGASQAFLGGIVAYTKEAKTRLLSVPPDLLLRQTAVSAEVAEAMARGAVLKTGATLGISITGVAGPEPDEDGNPVGLVYCGAARTGGATKTLRLELGKRSPDEIVERACIAALRLLRNFAFS
jgi:nicotinamide-nucleotide amidase